METLQPSLDSHAWRPGAKRGVWLALSLSLAAHALFVTGMWCSAAGHGEERDAGPISSIYIEPVRLTLAGDADSHTEAPPGHRQVDVPVVSVSPRPEAPVMPLAPTANTDATPVESTPQIGATSPQTPASHVASAGTSAGSDGAATTGFFGISSPGKRVVYLIDRSISMGLNGALPLAKRELLASLRQLPADARFQVFVYNRYAEPLVANGPMGLLNPSPDILQRLAMLLEPLRAEGGTNHLVALQRALQLQPEVIYLVTDGDDLSPEQIRAVAAQNRGRTVINAIEIGYAPANGQAGPLEQLSRQNGGVFRVVSLAGLTSR